MQSRHGMPCQPIELARYNASVPISQVRNRKLSLKLEQKPKLLDR
jgi:hypothetical protein